MTLTIFKEITSIKEERNITIHRQNKMYPVTKLAYRFSYWSLRRTSN